MSLEPFIINISENELQFTKKRGSHETGYITSLHVIKINNFYLVVSLQGEINIIDINLLKG